MTISPSYFLPPLPEGLEDLTELALDLAWSWNHGAEALWAKFDAELWHRARNPWLPLQNAGDTTFRTLSTDEAFREAPRARTEVSCAVRETPGWFRRTCSRPPLTSIAYLTREFGLGEALPINSGGLGTRQTMGRGEKPPEL
jgi:starch phosphorylase